MFRGVMTVVAITSFQAVAGAVGGLVGVVGWAVGVTLALAVGMAVGVVVTHQLVTRAVVGPTIEVTRVAMDWCWK